MCKLWLQEEVLSFATPLVWPQNDKANSPGEKSPTKDNYPELIPRVQLFLLDPTTFLKLYSTGNGSLMILEDYILNIVLTSSEIHKIAVPGTVEDFSQHFFHRSTTTASTFRSIIDFRLLY